MADSGQEVGEWIAAQLADNGMSPAELSRESGVARSTIDALMKGERPIEPETYKKLAGVLSPGVLLPLRQVVGGPRILSDAQTPRQALSIARRAIDKAEKMLGPITSTKATPPLTAAETGRVVAATEVRQKPGGEDSKAG